MCVQVGFFCLSVGRSAVGFLIRNGHIAEGNFQQAGVAIGGKREPNAQPQGGQINEHVGDEQEYDQGNQIHKGHRHGQQKIAGTKEHRIAQRADGGAAEGALISIVDNDLAKSLLHENGDKEHGGESNSQHEAQEGQSDLLPQLGI